MSIGIMPVHQLRPLDWPGTSYYLDRLLGAAGGDSPLVRIPALQESRTQPVSKRCCVELRVQQLNPTLRLYNVDDQFSARPVEFRSGHR